MSGRSNRVLKTGQIFGSNGQILTGAKAQKYCESRGLCTICGRVQVKERKGRLRSWSNIEHKLAPNGEIIVYEGYHISPGECYTLDEARIELGEIPDQLAASIPHPDPTVVSSPSGKGKHDGLGSGRKELRQWDRFREDQQGHLTLEEPNEDEKPAACGATSSQDQQSSQTMNQQQSPSENRAALSSLRQAEESSEEAIIRKLESLTSNLDVYQFVILLDTYKTKAEVARRGLQLMRELVFTIHKKDPGRKYVFPRDTWCKTIKDVMSDHGHDASIQEECATTITFVCSISSAYKVELVNNQNSNEVVAAIKTVPSAAEVCCVALESLTRTGGTNAQWREQEAETAFDGIKTVLSNPARAGISYAILALHNLTCHKSFRPEFIDDHLRFIFADNDVTETFVAVLNEESGPDGMIKALISLLRDYWIRFTNDSVDLSGVHSSSEALLGALLGALYNDSSVSFHEAICELLSVVSVRSDTETPWNHALNAVLFSMSSHTTIETVQVSGLRAFCNLFGHSEVEGDDSASDLDHVVEVIVFAMNNFERNAEIQAKGCLALASICSCGNWYKDTVVQKRGIAAVSNAFRRHVVDVEFDRDPSEDVKVAASSVLGSLALSGIAIPFLQESNLLVDFRKVIARDGISAEHGCVKTCVINLISAAFCESSSPSTAGRRSSDIMAEYEFVTHFLLQNLSEEDVQKSLEALNVLCSRSSRAIDVILSGEEGEGTSRIAELMESYAGNASIQEAGCALLLKIYYQVPFQGELEQSSDVTIASRSVHVKTHTQREISVLRSALINHKRNSEVVANACEALCNFVCGLNVVTSDPDHVRLPEEVTAQFSSILTAAQHAMAIHGENVSVMVSLLRLIQVAVRLLEDDKVLSSINSIARILNVMIRFPHDHEIHQTACSILGRYVSLENGSIDSYLSSTDGLGAIFSSLRLENEAVISCTITLLATLLQRVPSLSNEITDNKEFIVGRLIDCMFRYADSEIIQAEACVVLATLAKHHMHIKTTIANEGGILAIMSAMKIHRGQAYVLEYATEALGIIAEGVPDEIYMSERENICDELVDTLDSYSSMEGVTWATLTSLCKFCEHDEALATQVVEENGVPSIANVMSQHLASVDVQSAGCRLLWVLASKNDRNKRVLEACGTDGVLSSAILAHIRSEDVVTNALKTFGYIASVSMNKEALQRKDVIDSIRLSMDANLDNAQIIAVALISLNDVEMNVLTESTLKCLIEAMKLHTGDTNVQSSACCLLRSFASNDDNLQQMRHFQEKLFELLWAASVAFPSECGSHVQHILERLC